jgi:hypothetical protein
VLRPPIPITIARAVWTKTVPGAPRETLNSLEAEGYSVRLAHR